MKEIVTYVEMTAAEQLNPSAVVPGLALEPLDHDSPLVIDLQARIGAPYGWSSARRSDQEWSTLFARHPARMFCLLSLDGEPVGIAAYDVHSEEEVEIETFGLLPDFTGKNLGGYALTLTVERAWRLTPSVRRVWLHTSSLDHPHALPNYHRRGFRSYKTEIGERGETARGLDRV
ncbi:GNAT family N-acetyltransferase [Nonomuraea sp. NPDC050786]|uniref:GNAT family N-acetyltransferase n=1 Tax=Nonomuraea sp. NPDC050786 TaxID=3154840 RepID=UPI003400FD4D